MSDVKGVNIAAGAVAAVAVAVAGRFAWKRFKTRKGKS